MPPDITALLVSWAQGDRAALDRLIPLVQAELRRIAGGCLRNERTNHTLQPTALINEMYLRLVDVRHVTWRDRAHFLAMCARLMRRVLVDVARARNYQKRGGGVVNVSLADHPDLAHEPARDVIALDEALVELAVRDARKAQVVELRFFGGLTVAETAAVLDVSEDTVMRDWRLARAWLTRELVDGARQREAGGGPPRT